jgi:hypothetical protein
MRAKTMVTGLLVTLAGCGGGGGGDGAFVPFDPPGDVAAIETTDAASFADLFVVDNTGTSARSMVGTPANADTEIHDVVWNPARTRLAFVADLTVNNVEHVYVVDPAVGVPLDLTPAFGAGASCFDLVWSDDGQLLAFRGDAFLSQRTDLTVVAADGSSAPVMVNQGAAPATTARGVVDFLWVPGAQRLVYRGDMNVDNQFDLFGVDADGTDHTGFPRPGAVGADVSSKFAWADAVDPATNKRRLGFRSTVVSGSDSSYLFTVLEDGTGLMTIGGLPAGETVEAFRWEPGSPNRLAFARAATVVDAVPSLFRGDAASGAASAAIGPVGSQSGAGEDDFGYAGTGIVFRFDDFTPPRQATLRLSPPAGGSIALIDRPADPANFGAFDFQISPDGSRIVSMAQLGEHPDQQDLFLFNADGTFVRRLNDPFPAPDFGYVNQHVWSPDSTRVLYETVTYPDEPSAVFIVPVAGAPVQVSTIEGDVNDLGWTSDSAFAIWRQSDFPEDDKVFLATADGSIRRLLSQALPADPGAVTLR